MFGRKKKKKTTSNPEVLKAMVERDKLLLKAGAAVAEVDDLRDELISEYEEANGIIQGRE